MENVNVTVTPPPIIQVTASPIAVPATIPIDLSGVESQIDDINTELSTIQTTLTSIQSDLTGIETESSQNSTDIATLQNQISTLQTTDVSLQNQINSLDARLDTAENNIVVNNTNITTLQNSVSAIQTDISTLQGDLFTAQSQISSLQSGLTTTQGNVTTLQSQVTTIQSQITTINSSISTLQSNVSTLQTDVSGALTDIDTLQSSVSTIQSNVSTLQSQVSTINTTLTSLQSQINALDTRLDTAESNITTNTNNIATNSTDIATLQGNVSTLQTTDTSLQNQINTLDTRLDTVQDTWNNTFYFQTDCLGLGELLSTAVGSGATVTFTASGLQNRIGVCTLNTGTLNGVNGRAGLTTQTGIMQLGGGASYFGSVFQIQTLANVTDNYVLRVGYIDSISNVESTDAVMFRYQQGINGDRVQAVCRNNNNETGSVVDTGITPTANAWVFAYIEINDAGTEAKFYWNNVLVATIITNIPNAVNRTVGFGVLVQKTAGTTARTFLIDAMFCRKNFTTNRW